MSKYIDADALKEAINTRFNSSAVIAAEHNFYDFPTFMEDMIDEMPTADVEPVRKWVLCNERLPEEGKEVLFLFVSGNQQVGAREENSWWSNFTERNAIEEWDVIAWMPLPEPPKMDGGSDNREPCEKKGIKRATVMTPCIGYGKSDYDDEPCEMCAGCVNCESYDGGSE